MAMVSFGDAVTQNFCIYTKIKVPDESLSNESVVMRIGIHSYVGFLLGYHSAILVVVEH
jgi:hypothetical protein